jgi:fructose-1,6-bisphosphatase I
MIVEQAGGLSSNGEKSILDIEPKDLHERTPLFVGSKEDVEDAIGYIKKYG